mgnify:CR=1 FL=1
MTLNTFNTSISSLGPTYLGSMLFNRNISGPRTVSIDASNTSIGSYTFSHFGAHHSSYPHSYVTFACAIGMKHHEIDTWETRMHKVIREWKKQVNKRMTSETSVSNSSTTDSNTITNTNPTFSSVTSTSISSTTTISASSTAADEIDDEKIALKSMGKMSLTQQMRAQDAMKEAMLDQLLEIWDDDD